MANITVSVSEELKEELDKLPEVNWSEAVRQFLSEKVKRQRLFKALEKLIVSEPEAGAGKVARELLKTPVAELLNKNLLAKLHSEILKSSKASMSEEEAEQWALDILRKGRKGRLEELKKAGLVK